jgi:hypothetical protein
MACMLMQLSNCCCSVRGMPSKGPKLLALRTRRGASLVLKLVLNTVAGMREQVSRRGIASMQGFG